MRKGKKAADILVERNIPFNAIFAFTETLAIGAMNRLRELGKKIPEEIAVASFSGTELSNIVYPKLTTVEPPLYQMGKKSCRTYFRENQRSGISQSFNRVGCGNQNACIDAQ